MSERALRMIVIVVAGLVLVYAASAMFARRSSNGGETMEGALADALASVRDAELVAIRVHRPDGERLELT